MELQGKNSMSWNLIAEYLEINMMHTITTIRVLNNFDELEHEWDGFVTVSERKRQDRS
jgi:hypothetical protein